jgi:hypothetical protein
MMDLILISTSKLFVAQMTPYYVRQSSLMFIIWEPITDKELKKYQDSPPDEYSVKTLNILYNRAIGICFAFWEAPSRRAVEKHHEKYGIKCDWITEVQATV